MSNVSWAPRPAPLPSQADTCPRPLHWAAPAPPASCRLSTAAPHLSPQPQADSWRHATQVLQDALGAQAAGAAARQLGVPANSSRPGQVRLGAAHSSVHGLAPACCGHRWWPDQAHQLTRQMCMRSLIEVAARQPARFARVVSTLAGNVRGVLAGVPPALTAWLHLRADACQVAARICGMSTLAGSSPCAASRGHVAPGQGTHQEG